MGLLMEPSSRKAIQARPLAPNVEATPASLSILARAQAPAPLALMALTTPPLLTAEANTLKPLFSKMEETSVSFMPKRRSGLSEPY